MLSTFSYGIMKHCMQEPPAQKSRPNKFIEMGAVKRTPKCSNRCKLSKQTIHGDMSAITQI